MNPIPPLGVLLIANFGFWGGLYGLVFGRVLPRLPWLPCGGWASVSGCSRVAAGSKSPDSQAENIRNATR
jgi:hypothetical protein